MTSENGDTTMQNLWDTTNTVLRGNCVAIQIYLRKQKKSQNKQHNFLWKGTRKKIKSRVSRRKKIIKISVKISGIETKKKKQKRLMKQKSGLSER